MMLIYVAAVWVVGIALAAFLALPTPVWLWLLVLPVGYLVIWWRDPDLRRFHIILLALIMGGLRYQLTLPGPSEQALAQFNDRGRASLIGIVAEEPDRRDAFTDLRIDVTKIQHAGEWQDTRGRALVQAPGDSPARYGDRIQVDGEPATPPDAADFSYRDFLARESVFTSVKYAHVYIISHGHGNPIWAMLIELRSAALHGVATLLPEPAASLLDGILLGNDRGMPRALKDAFNSTNTAHIIAISGFNIALIAMYLGRVARRAFAFRPALADWFVIFALIAYTLLVGAGASVMRAAIMGVLGVVALRYGRQVFALNSLATAALLMTLFNPFALWDVGFQLSFLATLGLLLYTQPLNGLLDRALRRIADDERAKRILAFLSDSLIVSLAAWITTTPLLIATFHRLSIIGLLTNVLVLPAQAPIMIFGGLATLMYLLASVLAPVPLAPLLLGAVAQVLAWGAYVFLQYTILVVQWTAQIPFASIETPRMDWAIVLLLYLLLFLATRLSPRRLASLVFSRPAWAAGLLAFVTIFIWTSALAAPDPRTHIQFIATGGGDAVFIRTSKDGRILIDGSAEPSALLAHLGQQLPFWDRRLDLVVATNADERNLASLNAALERFTVGQVLEPPPPEAAGVSYKKWLELLGQEALPSTEARVGTHLQVDEVTLDVLSPSADDASGNVALRVAVGNHVLLLMPALHLNDLHELTASDVELVSEIAALPIEFDQDLVKRIDPHTVILFVGRSLREQPSPESLKLLNGINLLRTDERGTVEFILDGDQVEARVER
jgi:competence protein ComEC